VLQQDTFHPEDGGNKVLQNIVILPQHYTASKTRRHQPEFYQTMKTSDLKIIASSFK